MIVMLSDLVEEGKVGNSRLYKSVAVCADLSLYNFQDLLWVYVPVRPTPALGRREGSMCVHVHALQYH